jgi:hypothetical protein
MDTQHDELQAEKEIESAHIAEAVKKLRLGMLYEWELGVSGNDIVEPFALSWLRRIERLASGAVSWDEYKATWNARIDDIEDYEYVSVKKADVVLS